MNLIEALQRIATLEQIVQVIQWEDNEVEQILGKALSYAEGYPLVNEVDDGSVEVGEHTTVTLALEAADRIKQLQREIEELRAEAYAEWSYQIMKDNL